MDVKEAIQKRRAYRSLEHVDITDGLVQDLIECASIAPSCFNNQPWRYVFVYDPAQLEKMHGVMSQGNEWTFKASMIIAVFSKKEKDCIIRDREYYLFDTGMATAFIILRATELGLVAHPIAGFSPKKVREVLGIPEDWNVITLVNVGKKAIEINPVMSEKQIKDESTRPQRLPLDVIAHHNSFDPSKEPPLERSDS